MDEADKLCDRIAIVDHGKVVAMDTPRALKEQLGGESIILKTRNNPLYAEKIKEAGLAKAVAITDGEVRITVDNAHTSLPKAMDVAGRAGILIDSIYLKEPQLDDVFMHYTGRALREGGKEISPMLRMRRRA